MKINMANYCLLRRLLSRTGRLPGGVLSWIIGAGLVLGIGHYWNAFSDSIESGKGLASFGIEGRRPQSSYSPGLPLGAEGQMLYRKGYTSCYSPSLMQPLWVAWTLSADRCKGIVSRDTEVFTEDVSVERPRADTYDYNGSGYDRGHMCPAADNKWNKVAMAQSFLMSNICPQHPELNRGDWNEIEQQCRIWAKKYGEIYIVCGPVFLNRSHKKIGKHKITVPDAFFKVVLRTKPQVCAIGFICKNTAGNHKTDFYVNSVKEVERITGYKFFPEISDRNYWKGNASLKEWNYKPERYGK